MRTLKILGFFLTYPAETHREVLDECRMFLKKENWLPERSLLDLERFMQQFEARDLLDLQEDYVALFDRTPSLSLHLFEHIHGDSRERGQALVDDLRLFAVLRVPEVGDPRLVACDTDNKAVPCPIGFRSDDD